MGGVSISIGIYKWIYKVLECFFKRRRKWGILYDQMCFERVGRDESFSQK